MREPSPLKQHSIAVVGVRYLNADRSNRQSEILMSIPGEPVELRPEPRNEFDERAVAVFSCRGVQIGYLPAERCGRIAALIKEGREVQAIFQQGAQHGAWIRIAYDGDVPMLPPAPAVAKVGDEFDGEPEPEFYPDPEWPD